MSRSEAAVQSAQSAQRKYAIRTLAFMCGYVAVMSAAIFGAIDMVEGTPAAWLLAGAASAPILGQIWATLSFMRDSDEFVRAITAKRFIIAAGIAMGLVSAWGFAESFAGAPHVEGWIVYAVFWAVFGLVTPLVRNSN
jgi:putative oxidoreductase